MMTIPTEIKSVLLAQSRSDTLQQVTDNLKDGAKVLSDGVVRDLLQIAQRTSFISDDTIVPRLTQHLLATERLTKRMNNALSQLHELQKQLSDLRTYLNIDTPETLKAAVESGKRIPLSDSEKIIKQARERQKAAQAAQEAAKN